MALSDQPMVVVSSIGMIRESLAHWRQDGQTIALVPTMGNLHEGHMALIRRAREIADRVVVSIYVNPSQFSPGEDYERYPRTLEHDRALLSEAGVDLLFTPTDALMYPGGLPVKVQVSVPGLRDTLCGAHRSGHFDGVATVVTKLLHIIACDYVLFGEKDLQQLYIIRRLVEELLFPVEVISVPTCREKDGLALSSRNAYLSASQRRDALMMSRILHETAGKILSGERDYPSLSRNGDHRLRDAGFDVDYFTIRQLDDFGLPESDASRIAILAAGWLGKTRLIDNSILSLGE